MCQDIVLSRLISKSKENNSNPRSFHVHCIVSLLHSRNYEHFNNLNKIDQEMTLHLTFTAFVDDEEEKSEDEVGFGVYGAFKKFAGKVTNKALQSEESPKYSPTSPSLQIEETTLSPSKKELKRSRSKGIVKSVSVNV